MSINGIDHQAMAMYRSETVSEEKTPGRPVQTGAVEADQNGDVIDIKAIKAILYLGIKGNVYLPLDDGHSFNTLA
jgi:hypothetical protein